MEHHHKLASMMAVYKLQDGAEITVEIGADECHECVCAATEAPDQGRAVSVFNPRPPTEAERALRQEHQALIDRLVG